MKKKQFLMAAAGLVLTMACVPANLKAQTADPSPSSTLTITDVELTSRDNLNFKTFDVYAEEFGNYYAEFWLLPARYADGSYTTFKVYLNGKEAGEITPTEGNWQSARIAGDETLDLVKGINRIAISTPAPEIPAVETVSIAANDSDASISAESYENYLADASTNMVFEIPEFQKNDAILSEPIQSGTVYEGKIPVTYSFYYVFSFMSNQPINITTTSESVHNIDMVFIGTEYTSNSESSTLSESGNNADINSMVESHNTVLNADNKVIKPRYNQATSEEMQGLNWKGISRRALNSSKQIASINISAPKTGLYLIRVRHNENYHSGIADIIINGNYFYESMPISFHSIDCIMPADNSIYAAMTMSDPDDVSDPMIFIHGAAGDRIVGFNDDAPSIMTDQYSLTERDSYIAQRYKYATSKISVTSYSSASPKKYCDIYAKVKDSPFEIAPKRKSEIKNTMDRKDTDIKNTLEFTGNVDTNGFLAISAQENILNIKVFSLSGNYIGSVKCYAQEVSIPLKNINIQDKGIYVVMIETAKNKVIKKLFVNK